MMRDLGPGAWGLRTGACRRVALVAIVVAISSLTLGAPFDSNFGASAVVLAQDKQAQRFFADDPIWHEPMTQDVKSAMRYEPDLAYQTLENLFWRPGDKVPGQRAKNINTVDEVPDGPYFENRSGRMPLTPAIVARGANTSNGPAPGPWTVVSAKSDGVTPGSRSRYGQPAVVHQVRSAGLARHGDRQRSGRGEADVGRSGITPPNITSRSSSRARLVGRQGRQDHAARRQRRGR